jgi:hypothetical protein
MGVSEKDGNIIFAKTTLSQRGFLHIFEATAQSKVWQSFLQFASRPVKADGSFAASATRQSTGGGGIAGP